jgi:hypothetical protein
MHRILHALGDFFAFNLFNMRPQLKINSIISDAKICTGMIGSESGRANNSTWPHLFKKENLLVLVL